MTGKYILKMGYFCHRRHESAEKVTGAKLQKKVHKVTQSKTEILKAWFCFVYLCASGPLPKKSGQVVANPQ